MATESKQEKKLDNLSELEIKTNSLIKLFHEYSKNGKWDDALKAILEVLSIEPDNPYNLTLVSSCYYELRDYKTALKFAEKAYSLHHMDPLIRWDYAGALDANGFENDAIKMWKMIIRRGIYNIGSVDCTEGMRWARSLYNDCFYRIALSYLKLANYKKSNEYFKKHLELRKRGILSIYKKSLVLRQLKIAENQLNLKRH
jgi:tetratricopeptide (TPR) repeat protein